MRQTVASDAINHNLEVSGTENRFSIDQLLSKLGTIKSFVLGDFGYFCVNQSSKNHNKLKMQD